MTPEWSRALAGWETWCRASGHTERTIAQRLIDLRRFAAEVGRDDPWTVTLGDCVTFLGRSGWAPETRRAYRGAIRSLYCWAMDFELIEVDPTRRLPRITPPPVEPRPAPDSAMAAVSAASDRDRLILMLAALAGLRRAEVAGLRWEHVNADHLRVYGKGGKVRHVPLHPALVAELAAERARRAAGRFGGGYRYTGNPASPFVFPGRSGGGLTPNAISHIAPRVLGNGISVHQLRHRFATKAYAADRDLLAVQRLLGHAKPETTQRYADVPPGALERAVLAAGEVPR